MLSMIGGMGGKRCSHSAAFLLQRDTEHLWKRWRVLRDTHAAIDMSFGLKLPLSCAKIEGYLNKVTGSLLWAQYSWSKRSLVVHPRKKEWMISASGHHYSAKYYTLHAAESECGSGLWEEPVSRVLLAPPNSREWALKYLYLSSMILYNPSGF